MTGERSGSGRVAVIGASARVDGYALAGAAVFPAETGEEAAATWAALPDDILVAILTPDAAKAVPEGDRGPVVVVMPP